MKQVLIFIGLKLAELGALCVTWALLTAIGYFVNGKILRWPKPRDREDWLLIGLVGVAFVAGSGAVIYLAYMIISSNWAWAARLAN